MRYPAIAALTLLLTACGQPEQAEQISQTAEPTLATEQVEPVEQPKKLVDTEPRFTPRTGIEYQTVEWVELMPEDDLEALLNPPEYLYDVADGSIEDQISSNIQSSMDPYLSAGGRYEEALISTEIIEEMDGKDIRIPGFVVPVEFDENQHILSFFLVPFFGACIHSPPPPPNQIIYVESATGFELASLYEPIWISGKLVAEVFEDPLATSAYSMEMDLLERFEDDDY